MKYLSVLLTVVLTALSAGPAMGTATADPTQTRYSLVNGCYTVDTPTGPVVPAAGPYRMQATGLGEYLLYGRNQQVLNATLRSVNTVSTPSLTSVWQVDGSGTTGFTLTNAATKLSGAVTFVPATGCADYPEANDGTTGTPGPGVGPDGSILGTVDPHVHVTAYEFMGGNFHCGRPWHRFGAMYALPDCAPYRTGTNGLVASFLDYGEPFHASDTRGWPTFRDWPKPSVLTTENTYWTSIQRTWKAGLRMMTVDLVDNESLCMLMTNRRNPCNDMTSVRTQAASLRALQDYIDAQSGGPGQGFFRIVTDPATARQVAASGKLAVVMGMELSDPMNCGVILGQPKCGRADVDRWLTELRNIGVSSFFPIHKFDNAFGGTKMDPAATGLLVNAGNFMQTGTFWNVQSCTGAESDSTQLSVPLAGNVNQFLAKLVGPLIGGASLPLYADGPHCNVRGLTDLGRYLINAMIDRGFLLEVDHMDEVTADQVMTIIEQRRYPGVVSSHSWGSTRTIQRVYAVGGFATPYAGGPGSTIGAWRQARAMYRPSPDFGFGFGSDMNGLAPQGGPLGAGVVNYPFTSHDGRVTFDRERWGERTFDINTDGTATYGSYADWLEAIRVQAGPEMMTDMFHGAEVYLRLWERIRGG
ncbi:peptidase [Mycolicibacterium septicum]|uniref:peptidase n=1 Tax=Mycolicibacterium septicum TaxID=98668 RepID=UPI001AF18285|nr:peptidase [Mycolicibacterium septicum]QRY53570.1 peptidase [Mycolicibacterium septicum]